MRSVVLGLVLLFGVPVVAECAMPSAHGRAIAQESLWRRFTSRSWGFSVVMPGTPTERKQNGLTQFELIRDEESVRYAVGVLNLPVAPGDNKKLQNEIYDGIRRGAANGQADLISYRTIKLSEFPGREMNFKLPEDMVAKWRVYLVDKRAYFVNVTTTQDNMEVGLTNSVDVFLQSFRLIRKPAKKPSAPAKPTNSAPSPAPTPIPRLTPLPRPTSVPIATPTPTPSPSPTPTNP
jgi:hypothetical protein